jgi:CRISPR-associated protein Cmr1
MRPDPGMPPPVVRRELRDTTFEVETITRLFGGGAQAKQVDARCWLRPPAAKSAIRSWWRAASAHRFASLAALREAEARLFGSPATFDAAGRVQGGPGAMSVRVRSLARPEPVPYEPVQGDALGIAYFAGAGMGGEPTAHLLPPGARAEVVVAVSGEAETAPAVLDGVRLWLTLGGAGARSRRGSGALAARTAAAARKIGIPADLDELRAFLARHCQRRSSPGALDPVFSLARTRTVLLGPLFQTGEEAQRRLLAALREARQDRPHPVSWRGGADWGESRWPEADAIRILEGGARYAHPPHPPNAGRFPRAALGLPIIVHYKESPSGPEPADHTVLVSLLEGETPRTLERYASPIVLRPVRIWRGAEAKYVPVAIFTDCTLPRRSIPLVTTGQADRRIEHPIPSYDVAQHADATLARVEAVFLRLGFQPLQEAR